MTSLLNHPVVLVLAVLVAVLGSARFTRLLVHDTFPPAAWVRAMWYRLTSQPNGGNGPWTIMLNCHFCFAVWSAALCLFIFWLGTLVPWIGATWWWLYGILAIAYVAAMIVERDDTGE